MDDTYDSAYSGNNVVEHAGTDWTCSLRSCEGPAGMGSQNDLGDQTTEVEVSEPSMYNSGPSK